MRGYPLASFILMTVGCGNGLESDTPVPFTPPPDGTGTPSQVTFSPEGQFAVLRVVGLEVKNPDEAHVFTDPEDDYFTQQTFTWLISTLTPTPSGVHLTEESCHIDVSVIGGVDTLISEQLVSSLLPIELQMSLSGLSPGDAATTLPYGDVWGARLVDPINDPLPTQATDPTSWDQDLDGEPGVTVVLWVDDRSLEFGTVYVAQRVVFSLEGTLLNRDEVTGLVHVHGAGQTVLGAEQGYIEDFVPDVRPSPDTTLSWFKMLRVDQDFSCVDLSNPAVQAELFGLP